MSRAGELLPGDLALLAHAWACGARRGTQPAHEPSAATLALRRKAQTLAAATSPPPPRLEGPARELAARLALLRRQMRRGRR